ncbi:hypothetical protein TcWFU_001090 [Taenia crassiceps]|uniref:Uncharacterized protein n=1 Tax=Taenia crassiceps TaxID=6207 RepID=A0ABR4QNV7_9CEST
MGGKESHLHNTAFKHRGSGYGQTGATSYSQFINNTCQTVSSSIYKHNTFKCRNEFESRDRNLGGDVCSREHSLSPTRMNNKNCGDEKEVEEYHKQNISHQCSREELKIKSRRCKMSEHPSNEKGVDISSIISNETDTSSSFSVGDGSAEAILTKLKNRRKNSKTFKTSRKQDAGSQSSDGHYCISQMSSSSSPPSCCTPVPFVDLVKLKRTGTENKVLQQEQIHKSNDLIILSDEYNGSFNANISNEQSSGDLPDHVPGTRGDGIETRNDPSSSHRMNSPPRETEDCVIRWVTPKPSPKLGFSETDMGDIVFTAYIRMKGTGVDEYANVKKTSERRLKGLQTQQNCKIKLYDEPIERRTLMVHKLRIFGPGYREVVQCKNSLPRCITDRLITAHATLDEIIIKPQRRK